MREKPNGVGRVRPRRTRCRAVTRMARCGAALAVVLAGVGARSAPAQSCTPFGDLPATLVGQQPVPTCPGGGQRLGPWSDSDGTARYACLYESANASALAPLPLVVFLHPSQISADSIAVTNLLGSLNTAKVSDDASRLGFIVLAPESRSITHYYPAPNDQGIGWDTWYRQLSPAGDVVLGNALYKENVDAATIDHFIAQEVATGKVDPRRIYVTGWSAGAAMAFLYGTSRPSIAAIAPYSAPNPWQAFDDPCPQPPIAGANADPARIRIFNSLAPTMHIHNACDIAGFCPNGELMRQQLLSAGIALQDVLLDWTGTSGETPGPVYTSACDPSCGTNPLGENDLSFSLQGTQNHIRWPFNQTAVMLDFFRTHPALCAVPAADCRTAGKSVVTVKHNRSKDAKKTIVWKWLKGAATTPEDLGLPTGTTNYALCVYAGTAATAIGLPAGTAAWQAAGTKGFTFKDASGIPDGARKAVIESGPAGKAKALVSGKGVNLPEEIFPPLALPVTVQLVNANGTCFGSTYDGASKNTAKVFKATTPP